MATHALTENRALALTAAGVAARQAEQGLFGGRLTALYGLLNGPRGHTSKGITTVTGGLARSAVQEHVRAILEEAAATGALSSAAGFLAAAALHAADVREGRGERALGAWLFLAAHAASPTLMDALLPALPHYASWRFVGVLFEQASADAAAATGGGGGAGGLTAEEAAAECGRLHALRQKLVSLWARQLVADEDAVERFVAAGGSLTPPPPAEADGASTAGGAAGGAAGAAAQQPPRGPKRPSVSLAGKWAPRIGMAVDRKCGLGQALALEVARFRAASRAAASASAAAASAAPAAAAVQAAAATEDPSTAAPSAGTGAGAGAAAARGAAAADPAPHASASGADPAPQAADEDEEGDVHVVAGSAEAWALVTLPPLPAPTATTAPAAAPAAAAAPAPSAAAPQLPVPSGTARLYRKALARLNEFLGTVEVRMCATGSGSGSAAATGAAAAGASSEAAAGAATGATGGGRWAEISPSAVPARALKQYRAAFMNEEITATAHKAPAYRAERDDGVRGGAVLKRSKHGTAAAPAAAAAAAPAPRAVRDEDEDASMDDGEGSTMDDGTEDTGTSNSDAEAPAAAAWDAKPVRCPGNADRIACAAAFKAAAAATIAAAAGGDTSVARLKGARLGVDQLVAAYLDLASGNGRVKAGLAAAGGDPLIEAQFGDMVATLKEQAAAAVAERAAEAAAAAAAAQRGAAAGARGGSADPGTGSSSGGAAPAATAAGAVPAAPSPPALPFGGSAVAIVDVSGSMYGGGSGKQQPIVAALGLGLLTSMLQAPDSPWHCQVLTFEDRPSWCDLRGCSSLLSAVQRLAAAPWGGSTNFAAAFDRILSRCVDEGVPAPRFLFCFSDMQFNAAAAVGYTHRYGSQSSGSSSSSGSSANGSGSSSVLSAAAQAVASDALATDQRDPFCLGGVDMRAAFRAHGLEPPSVVFWNLAARGAEFQADSSTPGIALLSGYSQQSLAQFVSAGPEALANKTAWDVARDALCAARYDRVWRAVARTRGVVNPAVVQLRTSGGDPAAAAAALAAAMGAGLPLAAAAGPEVPEEDDTAEPSGPAPPASDAAAAPASAADSIESGAIPVEVRFAQLWVHPATTLYPAHRTAGTALGGVFPPRAERPAGRRRRYR